MHQFHVFTVGLVQLAAVSMYAQHILAPEHLYSQDRGNTYRYMQQIISEGIIGDPLTPLKV